MSGAASRPSPPSTQIHVKAFAGQTALVEVAEEAQADEVSLKAGTRRPDAFAEPAIDEAGLALLPPQAASSAGSSAR